MQQHEISPEVITELIQFLSPNIPRYLRQQALDYIVGLSASNQFNIIFQMKNFLLGRSLCRLACEDNVDENCVISSLINVSSADVKCAGYIASNSELIQQCIGYCRDDNVPRSLNAAKLLSNLSLHFPDKLYHALIKDWKDATADIITRLNGTSLCEVTDYLGYILVNLTSVAKVRCLLCDKFRQILRLVDCSERPKRRLIAIDILRNLCFEKSCHSMLLDKNDEFLSTLLKPLADVNDNLDDDEIEKLPIQLQYYEGHRCEDSLITNKIIDSLYQLCGSEFGRETLRIKGIYALLREFDRASSASASLSSSLSLSAGKKRRNSQVAPSVAPINEHHITDNRSYSTGQHVQMDSAVYDAQEMGAADVKCLGETENLTYIDGKNCSTLHAVIGILIED